MIETIAGTDLRMTDTAWPFAEANRDAIAAHWRQAQQRRPALFDGQVLGALAPRVVGGILTAELIVTRFSAFLAWRDWGFPDQSYFNAFGSAIIAGNDGGLIYGVMGEHTSNAGHVYPCGGSLEPGDVGSDGVADVFASTARELAEETGLDARDASCGGDFLVSTGQLLSIARLYVFDMPAAALATRIRDNLDRQTDRELSDVVVLTRAADLDPAASPRYALEAARHLLGG
ncbi:MAG: NUDIX hydrolase [Alphaproteobacteria bacterium]|nr:NUDIX hydrolase [Alphaproteobacteria bacterium]